MKKLKPKDKAEEPRFPTLSEYKKKEIQEADCLPEVYLGTVTRFSELDDECKEEEYQRMGGIIEPCVTVRMAEDIKEGDIVPEIRHAGESGATIYVSLHREEIEFPLLDAEENGYTPQIEAAEDKERLRAIKAKAEDIHELLEEYGIENISAEDVEKIVEECIDTIEEDSLTE